MATRKIVVKTDSSRKGTLSRTRIRKAVDAIFASIKSTPSKTHRAQLAKSTKSSSSGAFPA